MNPTFAARYRPRNFDACVILEQPDGAVFVFGGLPMPARASGRCVIPLSALAPGACRWHVVLTEPGAYRALARADVRFRIEP